MAKHTRTLVPRYKYVAVARDITQLLALTPALEWWQVRDYYEPSILHGGIPTSKTWDDETRQQVARCIDREMRYLHVR